MAAEKTRILIVDDEQDVRELIRRMLEISGYDVVEADCGESALYALVKTPDIALVLLDWMMPQMSGLDVLTQLREGYWELPVLMLSARTDQHDIIKALEFGANDYLLKPVDKDTLIFKIRSLLNESRESARLHASRRKYVNFIASTSLLVTAISPRSLQLESGYPLVEGSPFLMTSEPLAKLLDVRPDLRFACRATVCRQDGKKYQVTADFLNLTPELTARLESITAKLKQEHE